MARALRGSAPASGNGVPAYVSLERRLALLAWLNDLLGYRSNAHLLADTKSVAEGFDASGQSFLYHHLVARGSQVKVSAADLARHDGNIRAHLERVNRHRTQPITLRYFQHLAALYTEIVLDRLSSQRKQLIADLNAFVAQQNARKLPGEGPDEPFSDGDLNKLAYWMATGSGKTLILHVNYYQFLHYNTDPLDNILLVTPNEGLSEQHLAELAASGIPAQRFDLNQSGLWTGGRHTVQVIEITKLVEEKRGGGVTVPVEAFEGRNLIFVDEGHKGSGGQAWRSYRDALGATGFTFEYSATFGQALTAARNDDLTAEYGKAIVFDYSYRYFYGDGYGKDFYILNLKEEGHQDQTETLLLGNLLSFYQQQRVFEAEADALRPYNLEKPLWVFVGSTVNAVYSEERQKRSDVLTVARFLHHVLENRQGWAVKTIKRVLAGKSGLKTPDGTDLFAGRFDVLSEASLSAQELYDDVLRRVFHSPAGGGLHVCDIRSAPGELGLRAAGADDYFGLIYIGDTAEFRKLVEADGAGIALEEDALSRSLFEPISRQDSPINILIGAKKFMEGWNSWRVSNMGLLNIGRQEGSQIIQLFGRGVRLRGRDYSLKRSSALAGHHPPHVRLLETLNIFAVRADYMAQFREYLEREGVETSAEVELPLFVWANQQFLDRGLVVPRHRQGREFAAEVRLSLEPDRAVRPRVDLTTRVEAITSSPYGPHAVGARTGAERTIPQASVALADWEAAYLDLLAYKQQRGLHNLVIPPRAPKDIIEAGTYSLVADEATVSPRSFAERSLLQQAVTRVLRVYVDAFYRIRREQWEASALDYVPLDGKDPNLAFTPGAAREDRAGYVVKVRRSDRDLVEALEALINDCNRLYCCEGDHLPRIHFDRHLYQPLLVEEATGIRMVPPGLKPSEAQFVRDLKKYWLAEKEGHLAGKEVFLLRNLSRGRGVGFFEERGFYPDFILWVVEGSAQRIVFVEPHGMLHAKAYIHDEKARLHEELPHLAEQIGRRSGRQDVTLDSYIISATPYDDLYGHYDDGTWDRAKFAEKHILFQERNNEYDYMALLFAQPAGGRT